MPSSPPSRRRTRPLPAPDADRDPDPAAGGEGSGAPSPSKPAPGLHLVATPIGNLGDLSPRARATLAGADLVACEDTRVTARLFAGLKARPPLLPYHEHNAAEMRPRLVAALQQGQAVALVSDAGTPLVSDPGYKLVQAAIAEGIAVTAVPGPSAPLVALILSGLPTDRFFFAGFLQPKSAARRRTAEELRTVPATLVFFETAPRLAASLADLASVLGDRPAAVARELTKLYEEVRRGPLTELARHYAAAGPPRGEIVLVVGGPGDAPETAPDLDALLREALGTWGTREAAERIALQTGRKRREVYQRALALAAQAGDGEP